MARVFVSYRRDDSAGHAGRLIDRIRRRFGAHSVFMDVDDVAVGQPFAAAIDTALARCNVVLVVIGNDWLDCRDPTTGARRLDQESDWVRVETATALSRPIPVVPVLVQGATIPSPDRLPEDLRPLASRQAVVLVDSQWDASVSDLLRRLEALPSLRWNRRRWLALAAIAGVTLVAVMLAWLAWHAAQSPSAAASETRSGLFAAHKAVGGYWYQYKFAAYIGFQPDGSIEGRYYQYRLTGFWAPTDANSVRFSAFLIKPDPGMVLQWQPGMTATVSGDTLELRWPGGDRDYLVRRASLPSR